MPPHPPPAHAAQVPKTSTLWLTSTNPCWAAVRAAVLHLAEEHRLDPQTAFTAHTGGAQLEVGARADLAVWDAADPAELSYRIGFNPLHARIFGGELV